MLKWRYIIIIPIISIIIIFFSIATTMYILKQINEEKLNVESIVIIEEYHNCLKDEFRTNENNFNKKDSCLNKIKPLLIEYGEIIKEVRGITDEEYEIEKTWAKQAQPDFKLQLSLTCISENESLSTSSILEICKPSIMGS